MDIWYTWEVYPFLKRNGGGGGENGGQIERRDQGERREGNFLQDVKAKS